MEKRGEGGKYSILMLIILGLVVLAIAFYFIFFELFPKDDLNWEKCRQSIQVRAISPEMKVAGTTLADLKDTLPLQCKTEVVRIDTAEPEKVYGKISDVVAAGWHLFGEGKYDIVPSTYLDKDVYCMVFARVQFSDKAIKEFNDKALNEFQKRQINIRFLEYYRTKKMKSGKTYNENLPLITFADEGAKSAVIPYNPNFYPTDNDLLFVYTAYKSKAIYKQPLYNIVFVLSGKIFDKNENEIEFVKYVGMDRTIGIVHMNDLNKIGCSQFLTIPA
jgi:hypothetical protein